MNTVSYEGLGLGNEPAGYLAHGQNSIYGTAHEGDISDNPIIRCVLRRFAHGQSLSAAVQD